MKKLIILGKQSFLNCFGLTIVLLSCQPNVDEIGSKDWPTYLGSKGSTQYSSLREINTSNVSELQVAWTYQPKGDKLNEYTEFQCNSLVIDGVLYGISPNQKCFALNAATGEELWIYDPWEGDDDAPRASISRGLVYWTDGKGDSRLLCPKSSFIYALDAKTGKIIPSFGDDGKIDLREGLDRESQLGRVSARTPGVVYKNLLIQGSTVSEGQIAAPGHIRAYDVITGERQWIFHTIPHPGEFGYDTWPTDNWKTGGGANAWAGVGLDEELGIVYVPLGSANYDFFGGDRKGDNLFANCLVALNAETGERIWHYQTVHHDIWDKDLPTVPNLVDLKIDGKLVKAVAQVTKSGLIFLLDRLTGQPIFEIEEKPIPPSELPGEFSNATQPIPTKPEPFTRQVIDSTMVTNRTPEARKFALEQLREMKYGQMFIPPSTQPMLLFPGLGGGAGWGGAAFDPESFTLYINGNEIPYIIELAEIVVNDNQSIALKGRSLYQQICASCHGAELQGSDHMGSAPELQTIADRLDRRSVIRKMYRGGATMPPFYWMPKDEIDAIAEYLLVGVEDETLAQSQNQADDSAIYVNKGYRRFLDHEGFPGITPPWGTITAVDLVSGKIKWQNTLGYYPELAEKQGLDNTGSELFGGPAVTAGGLVFTAATRDHHMRAFDKETGELLWQYELPAGGYATPSVYEAEGKQYLVISCGGTKVDSPPDNKVVAFALP